MAQYFNIRSRRTGWYHSRIVKTGELALAPLSSDAVPVRLTRRLADATQRLLEAKFKMNLEVVKAKE